MNTSGSLSQYAARQHDGGVFFYTHRELGVGTRISILTHLDFGWATKTHVWFVLICVLETEIVGKVSNLAAGCNTNNPFCWFHLKSLLGCLFVPKTANIQCSSFPLLSQHVMSQFDVLKSLKWHYVDRGRDDLFQLETAPATPTLSAWHEARLPLGTCTLATWAFLWLLYNL